MMHNNDSELSLTCHLYFKKCLTFMYLSVCVHASFGRKHIAYFRNRLEFPGAFTIN